MYSFDQVANTSFVDATRFALKPCASKLLRSSADAAGNLDWYSRSLGWEAQTTLIYTAFLITTLMSAVFYAASAQAECKMIAAGAVGGTTCVTALGILFNQIGEVQTWAPSWDIQYPKANISFIAQEAPFYC